MKNKAYKLRIYPTTEQKIFLEKSFSCSRFIYNTFLRERIEKYEKEKKSLSYNTQAKCLPALKKEYPWLKEVDSYSLQRSAKNLDKAFKNFFEKQNAFPRFKKKKDNTLSYTTVNDKGNIQITKNAIKLPKIKWIKAKVHRYISGNILNATISKTCDGKYYVAICVEVAIRKMKKTGSKIGVDVGIKDLAVLSNGIKIPNNKHLHKQLAKLKKLQKKHSKKKKGSNKRNKSRIKIARLHSKITNQRKDMLHKLSKQIIENQDIICLETLNVKGMMKNPRLAKAIADVSWGIFIRFLEYKADWYGKKVVKIERFFPSSKTCHCCGNIKEDLTLKDRVWTCERCKKELDRDINAAKNILEEGLKLLQKE